MTNLRPIVASVVASVLAVGLAAAVLLVTPAVLAKPLTGQSRACNAHQACSDGLQCVAHPDSRSTCERVCAANSKCPEDQRCVKDGASMVCRPINDGVGL